MTKKQREAIDAALRQAQQSAAVGSIEERRAGFAAFMATAVVPATVRQKQTVLGGRPAVVVEPEADARPGTILYFHGGAWALGSPDTAMGLTANLVAERARAAEVAVILDVVAGVPHVFQMFAGGSLDEADQALDRAALFLTQELGESPGTSW